MARKVWVALFDKDLRAEIKKYPLNSDGTKIEIVSGGEGHFMPSIDNESFIELPTRKKFLLFGERIYKRVYFAMKWSRKCVNFHTAEVNGPDPKQVITAARSDMIKGFGAKKIETSWQMWAIMFLSVLIFLKVMGILT